MSVILLISLILLFAFSLSRRQPLLTPPNIILISFITVSSFTLINSLIWKIDISLLAYLYIILFIVIFQIGFLIGLKLRIFTRKSKSRLSIINVPKLLNILFVFTLLITLVEYFQFIYELSVSYGNPGRLDLMISYARSAFTDINLNVRTPRLLGHLIVFANALSYIYVMIAINNITLGDKIIRQFRLLPVIVIYILLTFLSGGRTKMLYLFIFIITLSLNYRIFFRSKNDISLKTLLRIIVFFVIFIIVFQYSAILAGRNTTNIWNNIQVYFGSSIFAFSNYINNPPPYEFFGKETLYGVLSALKAIGVDIPNFTKHLEVTTVFQYQTNIYTAIRRYIHDYTLVGGSIIMLIISFLYGVFYKISSTRISEYNLLLLSLFLIPLFEFGIEERILNNLLTLEFLYLLIYISILFILIIKKRIVL